MEVLPWFILPSPCPSFQPIFCSILLPMLLESMFFSEAEATALASISSLARRYFSLSLFVLVAVSSAVPYFCLRSWARSRYCRELAEPPPPRDWRYSARFCLWRSETWLCLE